MGCGPNKAIINTNQNPKIIEHIIDDPFEKIFASQQRIVWLEQQNLFNIQEKPKRILQTLADEYKQIIIDFIRNDEIDRLTYFIKDKNIKMLEEIGNTNDFWNSLHFACLFDKYRGHLISLLYDQDMENFMENINYQTREGWSPLMIAACCNNELCVAQLLRHGGINIDIKDINLQSCVDLASNFSSYMALFAILQFKDQSHEINLKSLRSANKRIPKLDYTEQISYLRKPKDTEEFLDTGDLPTESGPLGTIMYRAEKGREIMKSCLKMNRKFIDNDFPHEIQSIQFTENQNQNVIWLRPHQIINQKESSMCLFNKIDQFDIKYGYTNQSNFMAILFALSEYPQRLMRVFNNLSSNAQNVYSLWFYVDGKPTEIIIDDFIPCIQKIQIPLFCVVKSRELWPYLLEKAWAKSFLNYSKGLMQDSDMIMEEILGAPIKTTSFQDKDPSEIFQFISVSLQRRYSVILVSKPDNKRISGIDPGRFYPVSKIYDIEGRQLVKIKMMYGRYDWNGDYGENSDYWNDRLQKKTGFHRAREENYIFITPEEVLLYFQHITISCYQKNYIYSTVDLELKNHKAQYLSFKIDEPQKLCLRVHQPKNVKYQRIEFRLIREENNGFVEGQAHNIETCFTGERSLLLSEQNVFIELQPAVYYVRVKLVSKDQETHNVVLSNYSEKFINIKLEDKKQGQFLFRQYLKSKVQYKEFKEYYPQGLLNFEWDDQWRQIIGIWNKGSDPLSCQLVLAGNNPNCYFKGGIQEKQKNVIKIVIDPGKKEIAVVKFHDLDGDLKVSWNHEFQRQNPDKNVLN